LKNATEELSSFVNKTKAISKAMVSNLNDFVQSAIATIEKVSHVPYVKDGANIKSEIELSMYEEEYLGVSIGIYGDFEGLFTLVIPKIALTFKPTICPT
jgi:hypothetical protein